MKQSFRHLCYFRAGIALLLVTLLTGCGSPEDKAKSHYEKGLKLAAKGERSEDFLARVEFSTAVKFKSDMIEAWRAWLGVEERLKAMSTVPMLRRIVELDANDLEARLKLARIMVAGGAADAALRLMDGATVGDKPNADVHGVRAMALLRSNDAVAAVREAQRAYDIDRTNPDAVVVLASKKVSENDLDGALKLLDTVPAGSREETRTTLQKIEIYVRKKEFAKAEELLRALIAQNPKEASYQNQLLQLLLAQKKVPEAEKELRTRVDANPADTKLGIDLVRLLTATKGADAARAELEARIKAGGDTFDYQIALAELDISQNKTADAERTLSGLTTSAAAPEKKLQAQVKLAELHVAKGNKAAAEPLIAEILSKDRRNAGALRLRAALSIDKGQFDSAISDLREALNDQAKSVDLLSLMAIAYERSGKPELADRQYADALKSSNSNPALVLRYADFLQRKGEAARAEDILSDAVGRSPTLQMLSALAQLRLSRQNWTGANEVADRVARVDGGQAAAEQIRAAALAGQNKIDESIAKLEAAQKLAPTALQPAIALASAYARQGKPEKAEALLQEFSNKFPQNAELLVFLGQAKLAAKKDGEALQSFKEAVARQPKEAAGYSALTDFYIRNKDYEAAEKTLQAALTEQPNNAAFRLSSAGLQILRGNTDAAIAQYEAILKDQPNSLVAVNNLVSLLLDNRSDKPSLDRAFALVDSLKNSNVPQFQDTFGWAQYKQGDFKGAITTLEGAVSKMPNLAAVHYHLGMSYAAVGDKEKAAAQLNTALSLEPEGTPLKASIRSAFK